MGAEAGIGTALAALVGDARVRPAEDAWIVRPANVEQVGEIVAWAHAEKRRVLPRGGGTRGIPYATPVDVVLETGDLDRLLEHTPEDLVVSVECGLGVQAFQRALAAHGQWVPVDSPLAPTATVGGWLAGNAFGPRRRGHGTLRDWVIGTTLVRFDGRPVRAGGMVVKNVSGYDLSKLYIGSWGSLGVIVSANFKLAPRPEREGVAVVAAAGRAEADTALRAFDATGVPFDSAVWQARPGRLLLGLAGEHEVVTERLRRLRKAGAVSDWLEGNEHELARADLARAQQPDAHALLLRLHGPAATHTRWAAAVDAVLPTSPRECALLGTGVSWLGFAEAPPDVPALVARLREVLEPEGARLVVERQPSAARVADAQAIPAGELAVMRRLKCALDPEATFVDGPLQRESAP
jgi:glycolate oxidase FAD binding subunit